MSSANLIASFSSKDATTGLDFGTRDLTVNLKQPISLDPSKRKCYRIAKVILTSAIPNVYSYGSVDNTTINISKDGGTTWTTIKIQTGIYTIAELNTLINTTVSSWWADTSNPGFHLSYNPGSQYVYVILDSTKLASAGQVGIDFSVSQQWKFLGYNQSSCTFITDGTYTAPNYPQIDFQTTYVDIYVSCLQNTRFYNGAVNNTVLRLSIENSGNVNEIVFPSGATSTISSYITCSMSNYISSYDVKFINGAGNPLVVMYGNSIVEIELCEI